MFEVRWYCRESKSWKSAFFSRLHKAADFMDDLQRYAGVTRCGVYDEAGRLCY